MNELEQKLGEILDLINDTFDVTIADRLDDNVVTKLTITGVKNDGSEFLEKFGALFGPLVEQASNGQRELVYEEERGLTIKHTGV